MLNILVYQMLIVTNVPVNSATLYQFAMCYCLINPCGSEINFTLRAVTTYVLCYNMASSMSA